MCMHVVECVHCVLAEIKTQPSGNTSHWWEFIPHHISSVVEDPPLCDIKPWRGASSWETYNVWQPRKVQRCLLILAEQKLWAVKKHPSGAKERGFIVLPPSTSPPRPHLPVVLAWQREGDFYFGFSAGGQSSLGCGIRGDVAMFPLPHFSTLPSSPSGIASSAFHLPWETAVSCMVEAAQSCVITRRAEGLCRHAIPRMMRRQACERAHVLLQMISHTHPDTSVLLNAHYLFIFLQPGWYLWSFGHNLSYQLWKHFTHQLQRKETRSLQNCPL